MVVLGFPLRTQQPLLELSRMPRLRRLAVHNELVLPCVANYAALASFTRLRALVLGKDMPAVTDDVLDLWRTTLTRLRELRVPLAYESVARRPDRDDATAIQRFQLPHLTTLVVLNLALSDPTHGTVNLGFMDDRRDRIGLPPNLRFFAMHSLWRSAPLFANHGAGSSSFACITALCICGVFTRGGDVDPGTFPNLRYLELDVPTGTMLAEFPLLRSFTFRVDHGHSWPNWPAWFSNIRCGHKTLRLHVDQDEFPKGFRRLGAQVRDLNGLVALHVRSVGGPQEQNLWCERILRGLLCGLSRKRGDVVADHSGSPTLTELTLPGLPYVCRGFSRRALSCMTRLRSLALEDCWCLSDDDALLLRELTQLRALCLRDHALSPRALLLLESAAFAVFDDRPQTM
ncbi:Hypothetical protein UVM_LOCUS42 [uncultured virus]|nr:Hypothetical protein UVM_LOCUS42 [uncultured virus]